MEAESRGKKAIKRQKKVLWNEKKDVTLQSQPKGIGTKHSSLAQLVRAPDC